MAALAVRLPADRPIERLPGVQTALICQDGPGEDLRLWVNFMQPAGLVTVPRGLSQLSRHTGEYAQWANGSGRENGTVPFACSGENSPRHRPVNAYAGLLPTCYTAESRGLVS